MERRQLLKTSLAFLGTTTLISFVYPASKFLVRPKSSVPDAPLTINKDEIPTGTAKEFVFNETPLVVINRRGSGFIALSRVCTHLGCLVGYDKFNDKLVCPCHAGEFDLEGRVLSGPATKSLQRYPLKITTDQITIG
jgi:cytochrome b6-f complex iron-sulfur subunit